MQLNKLAIKDKKIFAKFLNLAKHELSVYAFENIYIWKGIFDIYWKLIKNTLCVFFKDKLGCFLYIPPQGEKIKPQVIKEVFRIMDSFNKNKDISRIENIQKNDLPFYQDLGYEGKEKFGDYLCKRADLAGLKGNRFKHKRASVNYFIKHYKFKYMPFSLRERNGCLKLYDHWMQERKAHNQDPLYQGMLKDGHSCLGVLMDNYANLDVLGAVVRIDRAIKAFTFGFQLNQDTFCILYEITDLSIEGLAQFIFREFCRQLTDYRYINIMDDSGLENLKKLKLSYHPVKLIPAYIIKRPNG